MMEGKPVVVGMGLKPAFLEQQQQHQGEGGSTMDHRERFRETMKLVVEIVKAAPVATSLQ